MEREIIISSDLINIENVRIFLREVFKEASLNMNYFNRIFLAISEAVSNAILHGNQLNPDKSVRIKMKWSANKFNIEIKDEGKGFCTNVLPNPTSAENIKREHGRGIFIMQNVADKLTFKEKGKRVLIQFTIPE